MTENEFTVHRGARRNKELWHESRRGLRLWSKRRSFAGARRFPRSTASKFHSIVFAISRDFESPFVVAGCCRKAIRYGSSSLGTVDCRWSSKLTPSANRRGEDQALPRQRRFSKSGFSLAEFDRCDFPSRFPSPLGHETAAQGCVGQWPPEQPKTEERGKPEATRRDRTKWGQREHKKKAVWSGAGWERVVRKYLS